MMSLALLLDVTATESARWLKWDIIHVKTIDLKTMALFYKRFISITVVVVGLKLDAAVWLLASGPLYLKAASVYQLYVVGQLIGSVYINGTKYEATVAASSL